eukprot:4633260-Amphidinium_carterae.1
MAARDETVVFESIEDSRISSLPHTLPIHLHRGVNAFMMAEAYPCPSKKCARTYINCSRDLSSLCVCVIMKWHREMYHGANRHGCTIVD